MNLAKTGLLLYSCCPIKTSNNWLFIKGAWKPHVSKVEMTVTGNLITNHYSLISSSNLDWSCPQMMMAYFLVQNEECSGLKTEAIIVHIFLIQEIVAQKGKNKAVTFNVLHYFFKKVMKLIYLTKLFIWAIRYYSSNSFMY